MTTVQLRRVLHLGVPRLYFEDAGLQALYEQITGRKTLGDGAIAFLEALGHSVEQQADEKGTTE